MSATDAVSAACGTSSPWPAIYDATRAELEAAGMVPKVAAATAFAVTLTRAADAHGGDFYAGEGAVIMAGVQPPQGQRWASLRAGDAFHPCDTNGGPRVHRGQSGAGAGSLAATLIGMRGDDRLNLLDAWRQNHGDAVVRASEFSQAVRYMLSPDGEAERSAIADALARNFVGQTDRYGRRFEVVERSATLAPIGFALRWPRRDPLPVPADPVIAPHVASIEARIDALLDDPALIVPSGARRLDAAAWRAHLEAFDAYIAEIDVDEREARRRWSAAGLIARPEAR